MFKLSLRSQRNLVGVHPDLVIVVHRAIAMTPVDFTVLEGVRSKARQAALVQAGASWTLRSRHLTGHAVDLGAWVDGEIRWDWPLYRRIADAMKRAAIELNIPLEWGGDWKPVKDGPQPDGPHFQLPWKDYP